MKGGVLLNRHLFVSSFLLLIILVGFLAAFGCGGGSTTNLFKPGPAFTDDPTVNLGGNFLSFENPEGAVGYELWPTANNPLSSSTQEPYKKGELDTSGHTVIRDIVPEGEEWQFILLDEDGKLFHEQIINFD